MSPMLERNSDNITPPPHRLHVVKACQEVEIKTRLHFSITVSFLIRLKDETKIQSNYLYVRVFGE